MARTVRVEVWVADLPEHIFFIRKMGIGYLKHPPHLRKEIIVCPLGLVEVQEMICGLKEVPVLFIDFRDTNGVVILPIEG